MIALFKAPQIFGDDTGLHEVPLAVFMSKVFGPEWIGFDVETLRTALSENGDEPGRFMLERIQALQLMLTNSSPWEEWGVFEKCCATINGMYPVFSLTQPPEAEHIANAIYVMKQLAPWGYSDEVQRYMVAACLNDGHWSLVDNLSFLQPMLDEYDATEGITRNYKEVAAVLNATSDYRDPPSNAADVQANNVLSVREHLAIYKQRELSSAGLVEKLTS